MARVWSNSTACKADERNLHGGSNPSSPFKDYEEETEAITYNDENLGIGWVSKDSMPTKKPEEAMTFDSKEAAEKKMKELDEVYDTYFQVKSYSNQ